MSNTPQTTQDASWCDLEDSGAEMLRLRELHHLCSQPAPVSWTPKPPKGPKPPPKGRLVAAVARIDGQWKEWR